MLNSLFKKNFFVIFTIFIFSFTILYVFIYKYVPEYYVEMQKNEFDQTSLKAVQTIEQAPELSKNLFEQISDSIDISYYIVDENNTLLYLYDNTQQNGIMFRDGMPIKADPIIENSRYISKKYYFQVNNEMYQITFTQPLDTVEGLREVLHIIIPYMILLGIILALLTSYIFATIISKPIIKLNQYALEIANLKFTKHKPLDRNDEIGVLSYNLAVMSNHLEEAVEGYKMDINQVSKRDKERKELMAILSHELKTPITILSGQTECMINGIGKYKDYKKYLKENLKEFDRLNNLVNQILVLSKVDNFDYKLEAEQIKLDEIIKEKCKEYQDIYHEKKLKHKLKIKHKYINSDKKLIEFIFKNLIENAFKYAKPHTDIVIEANDNFIEIKNEINDKIVKNEKELMSAFIQNDESRKTEGHGLGLYIVSKSLEQLSLSYNVNVVDNKFIFKIYISNIIDNKKKDTKKNKKQN